MEFKLFIFQSFIKILEKTKGFWALAVYIIEGGQKPSTKTEEIKIMKIGNRILGVAALALLAITAVPHTAKADPYCREYSRNVVIGGQEQEAYGTACRGPDGQWRIQSEDVNGHASQAQAVNDQVVIHDSSPQVVYVDQPNPGYYQAPYYYDPEPPVVFGVDYWGGRGWHGGGGGYGGYRR
jgi:hypothetical protein